VTTPGKYKVTYKVNGQKATATIEVKADQAEIKLRDVEIPLNGEWTPQANLVSMKGSDGQPLSLDQVTIRNNVNVRRIGLYFVKFTYKSHVSVAKIYVTHVRRAQSFIANNKGRLGGSDQLSQADVNGKIMLNDDLLGSDAVIRPSRIERTGGAEPVTTLFGETLGSLSGTLLYGSRRV